MTSSNLPALRARFLTPVSRLINWLFSPEHKYADELEQHRATALMVMSLIFGVLGSAGTLGLVQVFPFALPQSLVVPNTIMALLYIGIYWLARRGLLRPASFAFILMALSVPTLQMILGGIAATKMLVLSFAVPIVSAALLIDPNWAFVTTILAVACISLSSYLEYIVRPAHANYFQFSIAAIVAAFLLGILALYSWLLSNNLYRWAQNAQRRARQLEAAAIISDSMSTAPDLNTLLNVVVDRIREAYGFYHVQVFLIHQKTSAAVRKGREVPLARLEASTGRAGQALLARGHALPVGSRSVIGQCTLQGTPVVINDVRLDPIHRPNELLPATRGELALPLLVGREVIGALDVQSTEFNAFQPGDVRSLQIMAGQLAAAIDKARLVDELQARADENQRLFEEAQKNLRQIEDLNRHLTRRGWSDYMRARRTRGLLGYTLYETGHTRQDASWTAPMRQAYQSEQTIVIRQDQQAHIAAVPLRIRGEVIGVLEIERGGDRPWTESEIEMAEMLVDRVALAVENARLFEQATLATEREHVVNLIAQEVQEAETIDEVLQTALSELSAVLGASKGIVQISPKVEDSPDESRSETPDDGA